jgi:hypothetical protein
LDRFALDSSAKRVHDILLQTVRGEHSRVESGDGSGMLEPVQLPVDAGGEAHG